MSSQGAIDSPVCGSAPPRPWRPRFREYVIREHRPSFGYEGDVRVGAVLPPRGVTLYAVPREYHVRPGYRYAIVNDRPVIVEPRSRRIVEIIE